MSGEVINGHFDEQRRHQGLNFVDTEETTDDDLRDKSRKGSVDERILDVVKSINQSQDMYTSSSCSGRAILFTHDDQDDPGGFEESSKVTSTGKKGCKWLYVTHDLVDKSDLKTAWNKVSSGLEVTFKVESCILHIQCRNLSDAKKLIHTATESGFRNSGMVVSGKNKITVAVRSTISMEIPLKKVTEDTKDTFWDPFLDHIIQKANEKLEENWARSKKFAELYSKTFCTS